MNKILTHIRRPLAKQHWINVGQHWSGWWHWTNIVSACWTKNKALHHEKLQNYNSLQENSFSIQLATLAQFSFLQDQEQHNSPGTIASRTWSIIEMKWFHLEYVYCTSIEDMDNKTRDRCNMNVLIVHVQCGGWMIWREIQYIYIHVYI